MKLLRKIISLLLAVMLGFWLAASGILSGTRAGYVMEHIVSYLPDDTDLSNLDDLPLLNDSPQMDIENQDNTSQIERSSVAEDSDINFTLIESTIIELVNELRQEQGVSIVESNEMLKAAATIRAIETEESFSHTRPDGSDAFTVFEEEGIFYPYRAAGENLGMATYYMNEEEMAELLFDGWVDSEGHYENMIRSEYDEIGVGVHYDGEFLYATQLFGTQM